MEFGLALDIGLRGRLDRTLDGIVQVLSVAEPLGYSSVFLGESFARRQPAAHTAAPFLALASLAPRTSLLLGTGVTLLPLWEPLRLAYEAAALDQLSGGRFILGTGASSPRDWERFGIERSTVGERMDEMLAALKALWSGAEGFQGRTFSVAGGIAPLPVRPGGPPIWVGGHSAHAARRAARLGDGWYGATQYPRPLLQKQIGRYRRALAEAERPPSSATVALNRLMYTAPSREEALRDGWPAVEQTLRSYVAMGALPEGDLTAYRDQITLVGTPETVRERLAAYQADGVTHIQLRVAPGDLPMDRVAESVACFGEEVLPHFR